jgi:hypothetical protein
MQDYVEYLIKTRPSLHSEVTCLRVDGTDPYHAQYYIVYQSIQDLAAYQK